MNLIKQIIMLCSFLFSSQILAGESNYFVSPYANKIGIERVDENLLRWILFSSESEHPCLHVELLKPESRLLVDTVEICALTDDKKTRYDFVKDLSSIDLSEIRIDKMQLTFKAELILLRQGSIQLQCTLPIKGNKLSPLYCETLEL